MNVQNMALRIYAGVPDRAKRPLFSMYRSLVEPITIERQFVSEFFDSRAEYRALTREYYDRGVGDELEAAQEEHQQRTGHGRFAGLNQFTPPRLYALVRQLQPETIAETGVCNGVSTLIILRALEQNGTGNLYSVDLRDDSRLPQNEDPGWIIPNTLRDRWDLTIGNSLDKLPEIVEGVDSVDLFVHDSTSKILDQELDIVWPTLADDGVVVADDIHTNRMFDEVAESYPVSSGHIAPNVAYFRR